MKPSVSARTCDCSEGQVTPATWVHSGAGSMNSRPKQTASTSDATASERLRLFFNRGLLNKNAMFFPIGINNCVTVAQIASATPTANHLPPTYRIITNMMNMR